jgi:hypothetical protein
VPYAIVCSFLPLDFRLSCIVSAQRRSEGFKIGLVGYSLRCAWFLVWIRVHGGISLSSEVRFIVITQGCLLTPPGREPSSRCTTAVRKGVVGAGIESFGRVLWADIYSLVLIALSCRSFKVSVVVAAC